MDVYKNAFPIYIVWSVYHYCDISQKQLVTIISMIDWRNKTLVIYSI